MENKIFNFKVLLLGNGGVGKSAFLDSLSTRFEKKYNITKTFKSVKVVRYYKDTSGNLYKVVFDFIDSPGQELYNKDYEKHSKYTNALILMFDTSSTSSYLSIPYWHSLFRTNTERVPTVLLGNKVDVKDRQVPKNVINYNKYKYNKVIGPSKKYLSEDEKKREKMANMYSEHNDPIAYFEISSKLHYQVNKPLQYLARKLTGINDLYCKLLQFESLVNQQNSLVSNTTNTSSTTNTSNTTNTSSTESTNKDKSNDREQRETKESQCILS